MITLLLMISQLKLLSEPFISQWPRFHIYFLPNEEHFNSMVDGSEKKLISYNSLRLDVRKRSLLKSMSKICSDPHWNTNLIRGHQRSIFLAIPDSVDKTAWNIERIWQFRWVKISLLAPLHDLASPNKPIQNDCSFLFYQFLPLSKPVLAKPSMLTLWIT